MVALSTDLIASPDPDEVLRRLVDLRPDALALGPNTVARDSLRRARVPVAAVAVPQGPRLGAADRDEREAAVAIASREIDRSSDLECRRVVVDLGRLDAVLDEGWRELCDRFARDTLDGDRVARFLRARRGGRDRHLDGARHALERLLHPAERRGVTLGVLPASGGDSLGFPDEIALLCDEFRGGPIGAWRATDREWRLAALELCASFPADALGADVSDACGLLGGLPAGSGEVDFRAALQGLPAEAPRVVVAAAATDAEIAAALEAVRGR